MEQGIIFAVFNHISLLLQYEMWIEMYITNGRLSLCTSISLIVCECECDKTLYGHSSLPKECL